ncbi:unnamed protein product [Adineta steineri]|uniref:Ankyrin repeat protein n=1 Tax=Adineta steineri TaxID=433720 RepID=A0A814J9U4_9BILA|nr:unnamed protein product [Adineta steineri]
MYDYYDEESDNFWWNHPSYWWDITRPSDEIMDAITKKDVDYLSLLMNQLRGNQCDRTKNKKRFPDTILTRAIKSKDAACIRLILDTIYRGYIYPTIIDHVCDDGRTALWHACKNGDFDLVQELIEDGHATINKCGVLIVAAQNGHEKIVDYLLSKGCDPNRYTKNYNERALHAASRRNHLGIVNALLKHGADPTILDDNKRTALEYAIHKRYNKIANILINHHGNRFVMNGTGFTPLMLAAYCNNTSIVNTFLNILPLQQILDELALLACRYTIDGNVKKRDQAYCYFENALNMTKPLCKCIPREVFEHHTECQTLDELARIREDDDRMRIHALLVSERLLITNGHINHFISLIIKQNSVY